MEKLLSMHPHKPLCNQPAIAIVTHTHTDPAHTHRTTSAATNRAAYTPLLVAKKARLSWAPLHAARFLASHESRLYAQPGRIYVGAAVGEYGWLIADCVRLCAALAFPAVAAPFHSL